MGATRRYHAFKRPVPVTVVEFDPEANDYYSTTAWVRLDWLGTKEWQVWNEKRQHWANTKPGDYINITDVEDIYPIPREVFERDYTIDAIDEDYGTA